MKNEIVLQSTFSHPNSALSLVSKSLAPCPPNAVRVKLVARTINPSDLLSVLGEGQYRYNHIPPRVPGFEGVGFVIESNIDAYKKGDRVLVAKEGCWQKYIDVGKHDLFKIPAHIDNYYAAQLHINPLTSWLLIQLYVEKHAKQPEKTNKSPRLKKRVALNAANSTMGRLILQLLKALNIESIAITSKTNADELHALGASYVLNSASPLLEQMNTLNIPKPNVVFDAVGGNTATELVRAASSGGTYVIYGCLSMTSHSNDFFTTIKDKNITTDRFFLGDWKDKTSYNEQQKTFYRMLFYFLDNNIQMPISKVFQLSDYLTAIEFSMNKDRMPLGKVILSNI